METVTWKVRWATIQKGLADAPTYKMDDVDPGGQKPGKKKGKNIPLFGEENQKRILKEIQDYNDKLDREDNERKQGA